MDAKLQKGCVLTFEKNQNCSQVSLNTIHFCFTRKHQHYKSLQQKEPNKKTFRPIEKKIRQCCSYDEGCKSICVKVECVSCDLISCNRFVSNPCMIR